MQAHVEQEPAHGRVTKLDAQARKAKIIAILERHLLPVLAQFGLDLGWRP